MGFDAFGTAVIRHYAAEIGWLKHKRAEKFSELVCKSLKAFVRERFEIRRFGSFNHDYMPKTSSWSIDGICLTSFDRADKFGHRCCGMVGRFECDGVDACPVGELVAFSSHLMIGMAPYCCWAMC